MQKILLLLLCLTGGLSLSAQNGTLQFWTSLNCAEYVGFTGVDPANVNVVNLRIADAGLNGTMNINGVTIDMADRETYETIPMTLDVADNFWKVDFALNGGAGNSGFRWYFEAEVTDPNVNGGVATTLVEGINNDFPDPNAEYPIYDGIISFSNGPIRLNPWSPGATDRRIFTSFGGVFFCDGADVLIEIDFNTADADVAATLGANMLFVPGVNWGKFIPGGNGFSRIGMTESTLRPGVWGIRTAMLRSNFFRYQYATTFPPTGIAETTLMSPYITAPTCAVDPDGRRTAFTVQNTVVSRLWGSPNDDLPAGSVQAFDAGQTVTAGASYLSTDGFTYYTKGARLLLGVNWGAETPAAAADVSVTFGATQATFVADGTGFVNNGTGSSIMTRTWDVNASITNPVDVRFFFDQSDVDAVNALITSNGGVAVTGAEQMEFFKVNTAESAQNVSALSIEDIDLYSEGGATPESLVSTAGLNADCVPVMFADFSVASFSGGGGGAASGGGTIAGEAALPVTLAMLRAEAVKADVMVKWATASESANEGFEVQHSTDGVAFTAIGNVAGAGTSTAYNTYEFEHVNAPMGTNFYRLKQTDLTGSSTMSSVVSAVVEGTEAFSVFPNPAGEELFVTTKSDSRASAEIRDAQGRLMSTVNLTSRRQAINLSELTNGLYFITLRDDSGSTTKRFLKK